MGLWNRIRKKHIDKIEWRDPSGSTWVYQFNREGVPLRMNTPVSVKPGQQLAVVYNGQLTDLLPAGEYLLNEQCLPALGSLASWPAGNATRCPGSFFFLNRKTSPPLRWISIGNIPNQRPASGHFTFRIVDPAPFLRNISGMEGSISQEHVIRQLQKVVTYSLHELQVAAGHEEEEGPDDRLVRDLNVKLQSTYGFKLESLTFSLKGNDFTTEEVAEDKPERVAGTPPLLFKKGWAIYLAVNGTQTGPFDRDELVRMIGTGLLKADHLVWKTGMNSWEKALDLPELRPLFMQR